MFKWPLINNNISKEDKKVLSDFILNSDRFTNGPKVQEFEEVWSKWLGVKYSVMVNSGASANYITTSIVRELKGQGGEIIVPTIGWVSDVSAVINNGMVPVFVDVDWETLSVNVDAVRAAITEETKAIVLVHALGFNGLNEELIEVAKENDLLLIEDCCESHGATHDGKKVGSIGDMSCFSFYFGHHMTTIEGGFVCTNDEKIYQLARMFRSHGMTREASQEVQDKYKSEDLNPLFTFAVPGYNMRSTELNAVLGLQQMKRLDDNVSIRKDNLKTWLSELDPNKFFVSYKTEGNSNFALPLMLQTRDKDMFKRVCSLLEEEGVEYRVGTAGGGNLARQPFLKNYKHRISGDLLTSDHLHSYALYIGNHTELLPMQIANLARKLNNV